MQIRNGYKHTEVGVIPESWEVIAMGDICTFSGGSQPPRTTFANEARHGYIRLIQIRDYKTDDFQTYIPIELAKKFCSTDDIMIGRYGPPVFQILRGLEGAYNVALIKTIASPKIDKNFFYYLIKRDELFRLRVCIQTEQ